MIEAVADFAFFWTIGGETLACYNLRKPIRGHPKGSTVTRDTILAALRPVSYGTTTVKILDDFATVESPLDARTRREASCDPRDEKALADNAEHFRFGGGR